MKILIIAKLDKMKTQVSNNRIEFMNFLSKKDNIIICEDTIESLNNNFDIFIYYNIFKDDDISCYDKDKLKNKKKYIFFEDFHNIKINIKLCNQYGIRNIIIPQKHEVLEKEYKNNNIDILHWGFYLNDNIYKNLRLNKKYDILSYGATYKNNYKLRYRINYFLWKLELKGFKIKRIQFKGYKNKTVPRNNDLIKLINQSKFCIATSSNFDLLVKKYLEIPFCGTGIIGDIPSNYKDIFNEKNIVVINKTDNDKKIYGKLLNVCKGKYNHLLNNNLSNELRNRFSFENGYNDLISILEK